MQRNYYEFHPVFPVQLTINKHRLPQSAAVNLCCSGANNKVPSGKCVCYAPNHPASLDFSLGTGLPRHIKSAAHLRHAGTAKRCGCENRFRNVGAFLRRLHAGHLRTCDHLRQAGSSQNHEQRAVRYSFIVKRHFVFWVRAWVKPLFPPINPNNFPPNNKEKP